MSTLPKISVITPTLNAAKTLSRCIESVAQQTYPNKEHWIIDGLSTDETMDIVRQYAAIYPHIHFISEKDKGIYDAMNKGIQLSTGEWLYFLGADDKLYDNEVLQKIFQEDLAAYHFVYGHININNRYIIYQSAPLTPEKLLLRNVHHQACFYKRSLFEQLGLYDIHYKLSAEIDFNIRWMAAGYKAKFFPMVIAMFTIQGASGNMSNKICQTRERVSLLIKGLRTFPFSRFIQRKIVLHIIQFAIRAALIYGFPLQKTLKELYKQDPKVYCKALKLLRKSSFLRQNASLDGAFLNIYRGSVLIGYLQIAYLLNAHNFIFCLKNAIYWSSKRLFSNA